MSEVLLNPLILAAMGVVLAGFIILVDRLVNNYGVLTIRVNDGKKEFAVNGGASLLSTLATQELYIPSACGGKGSCGTCKTCVKTDVGPIMPTEEPWLTPEDQSRGVRLACQVKVKKDIDIEVPSELLDVQVFQAEVSSILSVTHDIKEVQLKLVHPAAMEFVAGQYMMFEIPPYGERKEPTQRAYSIAVAPTDSHHIAFDIRLVPNGIVTTYVHRNLKVGDSIRLTGPYGDFYRRPTDAVMVCVAGGSGMAPIRSILLDMQAKAETEREVWYFFGARTKRDLFYLDEMAEIAKALPNFHFIPALSHPDPEDEWDGEIGLITDVLQRYLEEKIGKDNGREAYLCGSPGMIKACNGVFAQNGISADQTYYDSF